MYFDTFLLQWLSEKKGKAFGDHVMKKLIFIIVLLIIVAGAVFYFGWVSVEPDGFLIAHSTLTGTFEYPLESGRVYWLWQKLIPGTFYTYPVQRGPVQISIKSSYPFPGSDQLKDLGSFNLTVLTSIEYSIDFDAARNLLHDGLLNDFKDIFIDRVSSRINEVVSNFLLRSMTPLQGGGVPADFSTLETLKKDLENSIAETVKTFDLQSISWSIAYPEVPQMEVYTKALNRYFSYIEAFNTLKEEELRRESEYRARVAEHDLEIDRWNKYGELISKYPEMLKYFYIEKLGGQIDVLVLPQDERTGFPRFLEPGEDYLKRLIPPQPTKPTPQLQPPIPEKEKAVPPELQPAPEKEEAPEAAVRKWYEPLRFWKYLGIGRDDT